MKRIISIVMLSIMMVMFALPARMSQAQTSTPILVVYNNSVEGKFGRYLGEILHAEGLNSYDMVEVSTLTAPMLVNYKLVILGRGALTPGQADILTNFVNGGGGLIAMRPGSNIKALFGLGSASGQQTDGYLKIINGAVWNGKTPGSGLTAQTLQNHGSADKYATTAGAVMLAELYSDAVTASGFPAVVGKGTGAGWAAAFTYDLPQNIIYTRQGNPANAGLDLDRDRIIRTVDLFQGTPKWLDLDKVPVPQADEQQRFFGRLVKQLSGMPLPALWYFPGTTKTMMIITSDAHANPLPYFNTIITDLAKYGAHDTFYLSRSAEVTDSNLQTWITAGHSFGIHPYSDLVTPPYPPINTLTEGYTQFASWFNSAFTVPMSATVRHHTLGWEGYTDAVDLETTFSIRMDTNFYHWGPWLQKLDGTWSHGYITGSGLPMKFARLDGSVTPVYQQATQLVDEQLIIGIHPLGMVEDLSGAKAFLVSKELIDGSQAGNYAALMTQFHVDYYGYDQVSSWANSTMAYAQSLGIPMWNADEWLAFTEMRDATAYQNIAWDSSAGELTFGLTGPVSASGLTTLIPIINGADTLIAVEVDGVNTTYQQTDVNGVQMAFVPVQGGTHTYKARYHSNGDLSITMADSPDPVLAGNQITYSILVNNAGPDQVPIATVTDVLPEGTSLASVTNPHGTCGGTTTVNCSLGLILAGESKSFTLVVNVDPAWRMAITNTVTAAGSYDPNPENNSASSTTGVNASADVSITSSDAPDPVLKGQDITYTLTVHNAGPSTADAVSITDVLPVGVVYKSSTGTGWACQENLGIVTCDPRLLAVGYNGTVQIVVTSPNTAGTLENQASIQSATPDSNLANNADTELTTVNNYTADMSINLAIDKDPVVVKNPMKYTLTVSNLGVHATSSVNVQVNLPVGAAFVSASGTGWICNYTAGVVTCTLASLPVGPASPITINAMAPGTGTNFVTTATVSSSNVDPVIANNSAQLTTSLKYQQFLPLLSRTP